MASESHSPLRACYDELADASADDELGTWVRKILGLKAEVVEFVASRCPGRGSGNYLGFIKGSFNLGYRIGFSEGPDVIIRFPKPGHSTFQDEKVKNEVNAMAYLREHTTIPIPQVHSWGFADESPHDLGPFIIMEFIVGVSLSSVLQVKDSHPQILDSEFDIARLDGIYQQIADYLLQLSRLSLPRIGSISRDSLSDLWSVTKRPLTYIMNELATMVCGYPSSDAFPTKPFDTCAKYFEWATTNNLTHLKTQRNLCKDRKTAKERFIARTRLSRLMPEYINDDTGPFIPFCDDFRPSNILVDPDSLQIVAVVDWEFTNAMPAQYTYDPPWWLLLIGPENWIDCGEKEDFMDLYTPRLEQFLRALETVEAEQSQQDDVTGGTSGIQLSTRMRESWESGRFWFNYASRKSFDADIIYWEMLRQHEEPTALVSLEDEENEEVEEFVDRKMMQYLAYRMDYDLRFPHEKASTT